jgi:predicted AAA+ superfamily ATPase
MITRDLAPVLAHWASRYPVVTLTGPRQSGKTTLCRGAFPDKPYESLEPMDVRTFAREDPRGFLAQFPDGAVLDEVQRTPELLGYLQGMVDQDPRPGRFILTGSQHFGLSEAVSQSLAGRTAVLHLLPPSWGELVRFPEPPKDLLTALHTGAYPRIHDQGLRPSRWLADYLATYVQRDVRMALNVGDLESFTVFLRLCAGSTGQELNLSRLGADAGISQPTARAWLSVLEASFLCFRLSPWHANVRKRLVKAPKLHFFDSGLVCHLLGIQSPLQLQTHPSRGAIFESWVASELLKQRHHQGLQPAAYHYREVAGLEVDLLIQDGLDLLLVEAKSSQTMDGSFLASMVEAKTRLETDRNGVCACALVHGGRTSQQRQGVRIVPWDHIEDLAPSPHSLQPSGNTPARSLMAP